MCDNSNESHLRALSCGGVFRAMQSGSKFSVCVRELVCMNLGFKRKLKSHFHTVLTFKLSMKAYVCLFNSVLQVLTVNTIFIRKLESVT